MGRTYNLSKRKTCLNTNLKIRLLWDSNLFQIRYAIALSLKKYSLFNNTFQLGTSFYGGCWMDRVLPTDVDTTWVQRMFDAAYNSIFDVPSTLRNILQCGKVYLNFCLDAMRTLLKCQISDVPAMSYKWRYSRRQVVTSSGRDYDVFCP